MKKCAEQKTAEIYAFPLDRTKTDADARRAQLESEARQVPAVEFGSGWYHDAAIAKSDGEGPSR